MKTKTVTRQVTEQVQVPYNAVRLERTELGGWTAYFWATTYAECGGDRGDSAAFSNDVDMLRGIIGHMGLPSVVVGQTGGYTRAPAVDADGRD